MNVLIVHAHGELKSFNGAMRDRAVAMLAESGHAVEVSDLYANGFKSVDGNHDFTSLAEPDFFKYGVQQSKRADAKAFAAEQENLLRADFLIFYFCESAKKTGGPQLSVHAGFRLRSPTFGLTQISAASRIDLA